MLQGSPPPAASRLATVAAFAVVILAPLIPGVLKAGSPVALLGIPGEALAAILLLLVLPWRGALVAVAVVFGVTVVAASVFAALDAAFLATIDQPFRIADAVPQLGAAIGVVRDAAGDAGVAAVLAGLVALLGGLLWGVSSAALLAGRALSRSGQPGRRAVAAVAATWIACAVLGAQAAPGVPVAAADAARGIAATTEQVAIDIRDLAELDRALRTDAYRDTDGLLGALAGKDVVIAFVESYGRVAVEGSSFSPGVRRVLSEGGVRLEGLGYHAESAFLTSPTFGGVSWLAHSTLQSGVWADSPLKYEQLISTDRVTLAGVFGREGWRTVGVVPSNTEPWPAGEAFYGYDTMLDATTLGYRGPKFGYARIPDQFTWQAFHDRVLAPPHDPVMVEIDLVSSHTPWTPLPHLVPWDLLGDGSIYDPQPAQGLDPVVAWQDPERVRELYGRSIEYSLGATISYLETYGSPDLVLVLVGDHQPSRIVSGDHASHDVPITIIAKDPEVMAAISPWGWDAGLLPSPDAPVWRMDAFRDRFLQAFSG
ncbi:CDP-alcohol phosphatidyltransferase [Microbacterium sp. NPDC019599]|uniref:CDP-alcohol phosphatidyltransferase n=1 Tax=Microbacterium sp. NPDC019599 TaxID=3154690 RepID=UPI0033FD6BCF